MAEVLFYHLSVTPLERTLPGLLEKSLQRGWRVVVRAGTKARLAMLDAHLWSYRDDSFLPHGSSDAVDQPVFLSTEAGNPNNAAVLMLVDGASLNPSETSEFDRVCLIFDGNDPAALKAARDSWKDVVAAKLKAVYWAQEEGRWTQKAESETSNG